MRADVNFRDRVLGKVHPAGVKQVVMRSGKIGVKLIDNQGDIEIWMINGIDVTPAHQDPLCIGKVTETDDGPFFLAQ